MHEKVQTYYVTQKELDTFQIRTAYKLNKTFGKEYKKFKEGKQSENAISLTDVIKACATGAVWDFLFKEEEKEISLVMAESLQVIYNFDFEDDRIEQMIQRQLLDSTPLIRLKIQ